MAKGIGFDRQASITANRETVFNSASPSFGREVEGINASRRGFTSHFYSI
jgi:hypothetical protein